jgi:hypothetical protein
LAIIQAGAYITLQGGREPFKDYLASFQRNAWSIFGRLTTGAISDYYNETVFKTYKVSLATIEVQYPFTSEILTRSSFLSLCNVWEALFTTGFRLPSLGELYPIFGIDFAEY